MVDPSVAKALEGLNVEPILVPGGFRPISDVKAEYAVKAAKIAVEKYNKQNNQNLSFVSIVKGWRRVAAGSVFDMVITAAVGGAAHPRNYRIEFWFRVWLDKHDDERCVIFSFEQIQDDYIKFYLHTSIYMSSFY